MRIRFGYRPDRQTGMNPCLPMEHRPFRIAPDPPIADNAPMKLDLALPLFALVDRDKIDPERSDLAGLAEQLGVHLEQAHGIVHDAVAIEGGATASGTPALYLVLLGVPQASWPAFLALAEAQKAKPFAFRRDDDGRFTLHPLGAGKN